MCLLVNKDEVIRSSKNNILVYKHLVKNRSYIEYFLYTKYKLNTPVQFKPKESWDKKCNWYGIGYHSRLKDSPYIKTHLFIIPPNTKYYVGGENESDRTDGAISENIIYVGKNNWLNRLIVRIRYRTVDL